MFIALYSLLALAEGDCISRLETHCGSARSAVVECEACVGVHIAEVQPCSDQNVTDFCLPPPPSPPTFTLSTEFTILFERQPLENASAIVEQAVRIIIYLCPSIHVLILSGCGSSGCNILQRQRLQFQR